MSDKEKKPKEKSFLETVREIDAAERKAALDEEARQAEARAKREEQARKAYAEKLRREKMELIKLKQGLITEDDIPKEVKIEKEYTVWEKIGNFFYHNKLYIIIAVCVASIAGYLIYDIATRERPDITSMFIAEDYNMEYYCGEITPMWADYVTDYNGDGKQVARLYYVPTSYADNNAASLYYAQGDRTKLIAEFQSGETIMIIGNKQAYADLGVLDGVFTDARKLFPDDEYAEELGYRLAGTDFKDFIGYPELKDEELYVSFRTPQKLMGSSEEHMQQNFDKAVTLWKNFLADHRVSGRELPETAEPEIRTGDYLDEETAENAAY